MDSKEQTSTEVAASGKEINIDITNGDPDSTAMKSLNSDETARSGLSKDELMKYANMPFWVRLRNILFAAFWIVWVSILIAAVGYVIKSPGCKLVSATATSAANASTVAPTST